MPLDSSPENAESKGRVETRDPRKSRAAGGLATATEPGRKTKKTSPGRAAAKKKAAKAAAKAAAEETEEVTSYHPYPLPSPLTAPLPVHAQHATIPRLSRGWEAVLLFSAFASSVSSFTIVSSLLSLPFWSIIAPYRHFSAGNCWYRGRAPMPLCRPNQAISPGRP